MQAVLYDQRGGPEVLRLADIDVPEPQVGEVLVRLVASSINSWDWDLITGTWPFDKRSGQLGFDISGIVEQVGSGVTRFKPGDAVLGDLAFEGAKAFAEYLVVKETYLAAKPEGLSFIDAAALPQAGLLAALGLSKAPEIKSGSRVLINGAGGGVGLLAIQLAKIEGAHVTGVDSAIKLEAIRAAGADQAIDYAQTDFTRTGERYDRIIDVVARRSPFDFARTLAPGGRLAVIGGAAGALLSVVSVGSMLALLTGKRMGLAIHKPKMAELDRLTVLCTAGRLKPVIDSTYPLAKIQEAFARYASGEFVGKIVIVIDPDRA